MAKMGSSVSRGCLAAQTKAAVLGQNCCSLGEHINHVRREKRYQMNNARDSCASPCPVCPWLTGPLPATQLQPILLGSSVPALPC